MITLILGGARSGKSKRAEFLAKASGCSVCYVATAPLIAGDKEWSERIQHHRQQRPNDWVTIEEQLLLPELLMKQSDNSVCILIDCLTLWLNNVLYAELDVAQETQKLCEALQSYQGEVLLVSNELGLGLVPDNKVGRVFRDAQGLLNQQVAAVAEHVEFMVAGLPLTFKTKA